MRTTISIDDDALTAAKAVAELKNRSRSEVISDLAWRGLQIPGPAGFRNGLPLLPLKTDSKLITLELIEALRDA